MKKVLSFLLAVFVTLTLAGCSQTNQKEQNQTSEDSKQTVTATDQDILIAYFSYSGNTEKAAQEIQKQTGGQLVEITRKEAYPNDFYDIAENEIINGNSLKSLYLLIVLINMILFLLVILSGGKKLRQ